MDTFFEVDADQIEIGDQVVINGEPVEVRHIDDSDPEIIVISGYSHDTGDIERYPVKFNERFEAWAI